MTYRNEFCEGCAMREEDGFWLCKDHEMIALLQDIADALERLSPPPEPICDDCREKQEKERPQA